MLNSTEQEQARAVIKTHWSIYLAFTTAIIMYTVVVFLVTQGKTEGAFEPGRLRSLFLVVSVAAGLLKFWIQSRLLADEVSYRTCQSFEQIIAKYWRYNFLMLALCEVPALLGLVIAFMTMRLQEWWIFFGISAVLFATSAPAYGRLERILEAHAARRQAGV